MNLHHLRQRNEGGPPNGEQAIDHLRAVAVRNERANVSERADGSAVIAVPVAYPRWLSAIAWALRLREARSVELDVLGMTLFRRIDGTTPIIDHIDTFAREHRLTFHEARSLVMRYFELLLARGLVVIVVPAATGSPARVGSPAETASPCCAGVEGN